MTPNDNSNIMSMKPRIDLKINCDLTWSVIKYMVIGILSFGLVMTTNNFITSDWLKLQINEFDDSAFRCGFSDSGFTDLFTGKVNCSASGQMFVGLPVLAPFMINVIVCGFIYVYYLDKLNKKYHLIGVRCN